MDRVMDQSVWSRKMEDQKAKNWLSPKKLSKSEKFQGKKSKKLSKIGNLSNFNAKDSGLSFLTPEARSAFNRLRLAFTEAPILRHFDLECHIRIETDASGYAIGGVLS